MSDHAHTGSTNQSGKILVLPNRGMAVVAHNPELHVIPSSRALGVTPDLARGFVDYPHCVADYRCVMPCGMRGFVDAGQGGKHEVGLLHADLLGHLAPDVTVDCEPPAHVASKVCARRTCDEPDPAADAVLLRQSAADDVQRGDARRNHLKECWRVGVEVAVDKADLGAHVAARMSWE